MFPQGTASAHAPQLPVPRSMLATANQMRRSQACSRRERKAILLPKFLAAPSAASTSIPGVQRAGALGVPLGEGGLRGIENLLNALELKFERF
ncbi:hypothetical protein C162_00843 [Paenibacillus sp. FSL R7-269]|nr:hypothetical protein C162_00843 [Paenibacillus sp. FSL R7-269]